MRSNFPCKTHVINTECFGCYRNVFIFKYPTWIDRNERRAPVGQYVFRRQITVVELIMLFRPKNFYFGDSDTLSTRCFSQSRCSPEARFGCVNAVSVIGFDGRTTRDSGRPDDRRSLLVVTRSPRRHDSVHGKNGEGGTPSES